MYTNPTTTCSDDNPEQSYQCRFTDATERIFRPEKNSLADDNSVHRATENENSCGNNSDTSEVAIKITNGRGGKKLTAPNFSSIKRSSSPATLLNEDTNDRNARSRKHESINSTEQGANNREQQSAFVISEALSRPPGDNFKVIDGTQTEVVSVESEEESSGVFPSTNEELNNRNEDEASRHRFLPKYQHKDVQEALSSLLWQPYEYQQRMEEEIRRQAESSSSEEEERGEKRSSNCSTTLYDLDGSPASSSGRSASTSSPSPAPNKGEEEEEEAEEEMVNNLRRSPHHNNNHQHCGGRHNAASSNARSRDSTSCCYYCSSLLSLSASDATARSRSRLNCAGDQALAAFSLSKSSNGLRCGSRGGDSTSAKSLCVCDAGGSVNGKSGSTPTQLEPTNQCDDSDESCKHTTSDEEKSDMQLEIASSPPLPTQKSTSSTVAADSSTTNSSSNSAIINDNQNSLALERNNVLSINTTTAGCCPVSIQDYNNSSLPQYHQQQQQHQQQQKNVVATAEAAFASGGTATSRSSTTTNILNEISRISPSLSSANVVGLPRRALSSSVPSSNNIIGCTTNNNTNRHSSGGNGGLSVLAKSNNNNFAGNHPRHGSEPSFSSYNNNYNNSTGSSMVHNNTNSQFNHSKFFGNQQAMVVPPLPQRTTSTSTTAAVAGGGGGTITATTTTTTNRNNNLMISHMKSASVPKSMYIHHQSSTGSSGSNNCQQRTTQDNNVNSINNTQLEQNLANNNVSNVNVNFYRAVPANVVCSSTVVPTIQCLNTINHDEGGNNVSNVHIMPLCNNNSNNMQYHPSSTSNINGTTLTNSIIANNNNGSSQGNSQSNTACNNSLLNSTFHQTVVPTATTQTLPTTGSTNVSSNCQSNLQYLTSSNAPSGTFQQTVVPATGIIGTTQVMVHNNNNNNNNQSTVTQISSTTASVGTTSGQFGQQNSLTPSRTVPSSQAGVVPKTYASTEAQTEETSVGCSNITAQSTSDCSRLISNSNGTGTPTAIDNARAVPIRRKERRIRQRKRRPNYHSHGTTGAGTSSSSFNNNRQAVVNHQQQQQQQQTSSINSGTALPLNNNLSYNDRLPDLLNSHLPPPYTSVLSNNAAPPNVVLPAVPPQHHQQQGNQMLLHSNQHHHPGHPQLVHQTSSGLAPPHVLPVVPPPPNSVIVPNGLMGFPGPPPPGQAVPLIHHHHHHQGGGGVPGPVVPIAVPPPPPPSEFRFSFPAGGFRRGRYSEELPKNCCGVLTWKPGSLRWFIAVIALIAVCCVLVGTILGAMRPAGRDHLTVSLLMIGVGIVLVTVSGIAWRLTSRNNSTNGGGSPTITCRSMFRGLRHSTSSESVNDVITGNNNNNNNSSSSSCPRRFIPRLASAAAAATAPSYGRPHHPYAAMMYPEFQYRPPPPSYQASMQEYRLRLLLLERGHTPQIQVAGQGLQLGGCVVSPPPTYRSHAGSLLRAPLSNGRGDTCQSEYSCPPSYRSQTSLARPSIGGGGNSSINDHQQTNSVLFQHHHNHHHAREQSLSLSVSSSNNNYCEPIVNVVNILASSDDDIVVLDDMTLDSLKMDAENNGSEDVSTLKMLLNNSSTEGARELDTNNTIGKEGNLVTIVQTNDQNPIIVTVSGSSQMESNNNNNDNCNNSNNNAVQIGEISSEMEILAHL